MHQMKEGGCYSRWAYYYQNKKGSETKYFSLPENGNVAVLISQILMLLLSKEQHSL